MRRAAIEVTLALCTLCASCVAPAGDDAAGGDAAGDATGDAAGDAAGDAHLTDTRVADSDTADAGAPDTGSGDCGMTCQVHPQCAARGGECTLVGSVGDPCPAGSYDPFQGSLAECPTGAIRLCCMPTGGYGSPCDSSNPCDDLGCLSEASGYPAGGFCSGACDPGASLCPDWAICMPVQFSAALGMCMLRCTGDEQCRAGLSCQALPRAPFGTGHDVNYVCWQARAQTGSLGLGETCAISGDCLSNWCLADPRGGGQKCTGACDDANPCLGGDTCVPVAGCTTSGCGACFAS